MRRFACQTEKYGLNFNDHDGSDHDCADERKKYKLHTTEEEITSKQKLLTKQRILKASSVIVLFKGKDY